VFLRMNPQQKTDASKPADPAPKPEG
jgi:hypothetical protein